MTPKLLTNCTTSTAPWWARVRGDFLNFSSTERQSSSLYLRPTAGRDTVISGMEEGGAESVSRPTESTRKMPRAYKTPIGVLFSGPWALPWAPPGGFGPLPRPPKP